MSAPGHPGGGESLLYIDAGDAAVRSGRAHDAHVELAGEADVVGEAPFPEEQGPVLEPPQIFADTAHQAALPAGSSTARKIHARSGADTARALSAEGPRQGGASRS